MKWLGPGSTVRRIRTLTMVVGCLAAMWWPAGRPVAEPPELRPDGRIFVPNLGPHDPAALLCERDDLPAGLILDGAAVDSIGRSFSRHNSRVVGLADSLYRAGRFGTIGEQATRERAMIFLQLRAWNAMHYLANLSTDERGVGHITDPDELAAYTDQYRNLAIYPLRFIEEARIGARAFCVRYNIPKGFDRHIPYGDETVRLRHERAKVPEVGRVDVICREHSPEPGKTLDLLFSTENFSGDVLVERIVDRGDTLNLVTLANIEGLWVRKSGLHRMTALTVWWNDVDGLRDPANVRIGGCAYFPEIKFALPSFLPDLDLADLRDFAFPPPIFATELFRNPQFVFPAWIETFANGQFRGWQSHGPRPRLVEQRFPDM